MPKRPAANTHTCELCGRKGTRGFHRVIMVHPKPDKWFCDNYVACHKRIEANFAVITEENLGSPRKSKGEGHDAAWGSR